MEPNYRQYARGSATLAGLESERRALMDELGKAQEALYSSWDPCDEAVTPGRERLERLLSRLAGIEGEIRRAQAELLIQDARLSAREARRNVVDKALRVAPLLAVSLALLFMTVVLDGYVEERERPRAAREATDPAPPSSSAVARQAGSARPRDWRSSEEQEALARVQCIEGLIHDRAGSLAGGCAQASVTVSLRGPRAVSRPEQMAVKAADREVVSEWRFPSSIELRQAAALASALKAVEKDEHRSALQKTWAAVSVPVQVVCVFGVLLAVALLIAELARGAGFNWRIEKFMSERLALKDAGGDGGKTATNASAGAALAGLLGALPLLLLLLIAMVSWSSWRTLAPRDSLQSIVDRTVVHTPVFAHAASAPIHVTVSSQQIDDNLHILARQVALLAQANEESRQAALSSAGWLKNVERGAQASQRPLQAAADAAQSLGGAVQQIGEAASQTQKATSAIGDEARKAAEHYAQAARKMDESASATLKRIQADEKNLADTKAKFDKFAKHVQETKWGHGIPADGRP